MDFSNNNYCKDAGRDWKFTQSEYFFWQYTIHLMHSLGDQMSNQPKKKNSYSKVDSSHGSLNQPLIDGSIPMGTGGSTGQRSNHLGGTPQPFARTENEYQTNNQFQEDFDKRKPTFSHTQEDLQIAFMERLDDKNRIIYHDHNETSNINHTQSIKEGDLPIMSGSLIEKTQIHQDEVRRLGNSEISNTSNVEKDRQRNLSMVQPGTIIENKPLYEEIYRCISYNDVNTLKDLLLREENGAIYVLLCALNLIEIRDARRFTVLAFACYKNNEECFMILYDHALDKNLTGISKFEDKQRVLSDWANSPTDEEFTALHFATYHGNYNLIKFLIDNANADIYKKNKFGSTVLHIAAQGDQAMPLYFFRSRGMDINVRDNRHSTPLHWACYSKSEVALNYLLSMDPDLNAQDQKGYSPLHLAVKSVEALKSTRPVRALLLKGANRDAIDNEGKTASAMIGPNVPEQTKNDLEAMLARPSYWECLMIKTPLTPLKQNHKTQIMLTVILALILFSFWVIIFPNQDQIYFAVINGVLALLMIISYILASHVDPGKLRPAEDIDFLELMQKFPPTDLCPDCMVIRTRRSRHCAICNVCVERFDHHCPWINNCVGVRNHNFFLAFLGSAFLFIYTSLAIVIQSFIAGFLDENYHEYGNKNPLEALCLAELCHNLPLWYTILSLITIAAAVFVVPVTQGNDTQ